MYYTYAHIRPDTGVIFNVGKGSKRRAFSNKNRNKDWHCIVNDNKGKFEVRILNWFNAEQDALNAEVWQIAQLAHLGHLINKTSGGQGISGYNHSDDLKQRYSKEKKGLPVPQVRTPEAIDKMAKTLSIKMKSKVVPQFQTNSAKEKRAQTQSKNMKGILPPQLDTPEARKKRGKTLSLNRKGKPTDWLRTPAALENLSKATSKRLKGIVPTQMLTPAAILKMSITQSERKRGKPTPWLHTPEIIEKREIKKRRKYEYWGT